jgi:hypothetical protein
MYKYQGMYGTRLKYMISCLASNYDTDAVKQWLRATGMLFT